MIPKIGDWVKKHREHMVTGFLVALVGWSAYNLGVIRGRAGSTPLQEAAVFQPRQGIVSQAPATERGSSTPAIDRSDTRVMASKSSSSKKYHHPWCSSGQRIKEANRIWFPSAADAQAAGYTLAGNCTSK